MSQFRNLTENILVSPQLALEDIAAAAAFLLGPESGWITGQVMAVDGGRSRVRTKG